MTWRTPPARGKPDLRALKVNEIRSLLREAESTDYYLPIYLAIYTGLRRSNILGLRWRDVDLEDRVLTVNRAMVSIKGDRTNIGEPKSRHARRVVAISLDNSMLPRLQRERREAQLE